MLKRGFNRRDRMLFLEHLDTYVSAGLTLSAALAAAGSGSSREKKEILAKVRDSVEHGGSLSRSLKEHMKLSPALVGLIEHGEASGQLSKALGSARSIIEREDALMKTCMSAMAYPIVIGAFAVILTIGLMRGVMPQIIPLLTSLHVQLPLLTRVVILISNNLVSYGLYALISICIGVPTLIFVYKKARPIRALCHRIILVVPILNSLVRHYSLSLLARSLGALISSGAASPDSYAKVASKVPFLPLRMSFEKETGNVSRGIPLGTVLGGMKHMPSYMAPLVSAGEASGTLGTSLVRAADILDRDIEHSLKRLTGLVEPVMMAVLGCAVGSIALSIMMPIYDVSKALQH